METIGIILFCALMTTVAVLLLVESGTALGAGEKTDEPLQIVPLVCVACASKFSQPLTDVVVRLWSTHTNHPFKM